MAKGLEALLEMGADVDARKAAGGGGGNKLFFKLNDGDTATVRFLEDGEDLHAAWVHDVPPTGDEKYPRQVVCRDQDEFGRRIGEACPGCEKDYKRKIRGAVNVIWRDSPVYETDADGNYVKDSKNGLVDTGRTDDQVAIWTGGKVVFVDELIPLDQKFRGLTSRDFEITRKGEKLNTTYSIFPADPDGGPKAMSKKDKELASDKYDLSFYVEAPPYEEWGQKRQGQGDREPLTVAETSVFMRGRK